MVNGLYSEPLRWRKKLELYRVGDQTTGLLCIEQNVALVIDPFLPVKV